jgi:hypothetical protein
VTGLPYQRMPIDPSDGFPQSFRLLVADVGYTISLYVTVTDESLLTGEVLDLPLPGAYLVLDVRRDGPGGPVPIFRRKLVAGWEYAAAELGFVFTRMRVDPRNLNASGRFGSDVTAGVVRRWAS